MAKQFFKEFMDIDEILKKDRMLAEFRVYTQDNDTCFEAVRRYLYSYKWCRSDREKILLETAGSVKRGEVIAQENNIQYNSYRSMSSRVSNRLYNELGKNLKHVVLGNNKEEQDKLIRYCILRVDEYQIMNEYPEFLVSELEKIVTTEKASIEDDFKIRKTDLVILSFLANYSFDSVLKKMSLLDSERLTTFYTILTDKRYFKQRAEVLPVIKRMQELLSLNIMQNEADCITKQGVVISKKEYEEYLKIKQGGM